MQREIVPPGVGRWWYAVLNRARERLQRPSRLERLAMMEEDERRRATLEQVEAAHREWQCARNLFEHASDRDVIDQAIHRMKAAERRYVYLLAEARREGIGAFAGLPPGKHGRPEQAQRAKGA